ncbi:hypothetical protein HMPREF3034_02572 [Prevotella sp. DNF00663]|uniref:RsiV family protein n=1 Tax=Prevotella sp. DNF00663 TaxID=1384078 RepID=UPI00078410A2|nr:RsiV family protein [Prevotella sp. DNF00663]KXB78430.1 hypothetical protein HMPREF3034_02572 [Prevotella sp. DNF00663]
MKKLLVAALVALLVVSCGNYGHSISKLKDIEFDSVTVDSVYNLTKEPNSPRISISFRILYAKGKKANIINDSLLQSAMLGYRSISAHNNHLSFKQRIDTIASLLIADYKDSYSDMYMLDRNNPDNYNFKCHIRTKVESFKNNIITYTANVYYRLNKELEVHLPVALNFNATTGQLIHLDDLFVSGYQPLLNEIIEKELIEQFHAGDQAGLRKMKICAYTPIYPSENFILKKDKIIFVYEQEEIAPHDKGEIRVAIDNEELTKILK